MSKLTKRQSEILHLIENHIASTGAPPTRAEIAQIMGFRSPNAAEDHLKALARKGIIKLVPGTSRGIRLLQSNNLNSLPNQGLPIIGSVAAGNPILAEENIESFYDVDKNAFQQSANYLLRVKGDSMINAGILDEDLLAVHTANIAEQGQIVVARIEDEVTVKRFYKDGSNVQLKAENSNFPTINIDLNQTPLVIEGIAVGILRTTIS